MENQAGNNIMPGEVWKWRFVEKTLHQLAEEYNYEEVRTSIVQPNAMIESAFSGAFSRPDDPRIASTYYSLNEPGLGLRTENTIAVLHSEIPQTARLSVQKVYYQGPVFPRGAGTLYRHQFGFEILGSPSIITEIELMRIAHRICRRLRIPNPIIEITSHGCDTCRPKYIEAMHQFRAGQTTEACRECPEATLFHPLQTTDCNHESCRQLTANAPKITDYLCEDCRRDLTYIQRVLSNLSTEHVVNPFLVRPYGYYQRTVFNVVSEVQGKRSIIGGGGRYDQLAERITGERLPAVGFSIELENLIGWMGQFDLFEERVRPFAVYACSHTPELDLVLLQITQELHDHSVHTVQESTSAPIEDIIDRAMQRRCSLIILLREDVIRQGKVWVVNLIKENEDTIDLSELLEYVLRLRKSVELK